MGTNIIIIIKVVFDIVFLDILFYRKGCEANYRKRKEVKKPASKPKRKAKKGKKSISQEEVEAEFASIIKQIQHVQDPQKPHCMFVEARTAHIYLELGQRALMPLRKSPQVTEKQIQENAALNEKPICFPKPERVMQATIRNVHIHESMQKRGVFSRLIQWLLNRDGCVHLEAVQPKWLKRRLHRSTYWIRQNIAEGFDDPGEEYNPCYARFASSIDPVPPVFQLF